MSGIADGQLADPVEETRRLISAAASQGLLLRALGGVAVYLLAPEGKPRLPRPIKDIDLAVPKGIDASFVADLCARDWGLWRTCVGSIDRLQANLESSQLDPGEARYVQEQLDALRGHLEAAPKTMKWRLRSQVGDKVRWYQQPEEEHPGGGARS